MKLVAQIFALILSLSMTTVWAQERYVPDLTTLLQSGSWTTHNAVVDAQDGVIKLKVSGEDGMVYHRDITFTNGRIEFDIKGKDMPGANFAGLAFDIADENTFDAVYFRPFNFHSTTKATSSIQYISHPTYDWRKLRTESPGEYESEVEPRPDPNDWFHVRIEINGDQVEVFVDESTNPSLSVNKLHARPGGKIGFWVGYRTEAWFKNLVISSD